MPPLLPAVKLDYPMTPKEDLTMVFDKKKLLLVPNMNTEKGLVSCPHDNDRPFFAVSGKDWLGVDWTYVETVAGKPGR